jgi:hypothetical protein
MQNIPLSNSVANAGANPVANADDTAVILAQNLKKQVESLNSANEALMQRLVVSETQLITAQAEARAAQAEAATAQNMVTIVKQQNLQQLQAAQAQIQQLQFQNALLLQMFQELQGGVQGGAQGGAQE